MSTSPPSTTAAEQWHAFWPVCGHPANGGWGSDLHRLFRYVEGFLDGPTDCATRCLTFDDER